METPTYEEQRVGWRRQWLTAIQAFADAETQSRRWTDPSETNPHYSFVECMCGYFDDAYMGEDRPYEHRLMSGRLSLAEANAMTQFHSAAAAYKPPKEDYYAVSAILADPAWQHVVRLAQDAQQRLLPLLTDPSEQSALIKPNKWTEQDGVFYSHTRGTSYVP